MTLVQRTAVTMALRRLKEAFHWQIIGMDDRGMLYRDIGRQLGYYHSVISGLVTRHGQTREVKDRLRTGPPRKTTVWEGKCLAIFVRR